VPGRSLGSVPTASLGCVLLALVVGAQVGWGQPAWWAVPALAAAVAAAEVAVVHLQVGRQRWTFSLTEAALVAAMVCAAGAWVACAVAVGVLVAQRLRSQPAVKLGFNVAQFSLAAALAALVAQAVGGGAFGACAGLVVFWFVNYALVAVVVAVTAGRGLRGLVVSSAPLSALHTAGNASIGLLAAHLALTAPVGLLGLVVPLALLWVSYDQQARRSAEARLYAELARGQERSRSHSTDVSAQVVLTAAARLFGGADVEMVLLAPEGPVRYAGNEDGVPERVRVAPDAFDEPWVLRALGAGRVVVGTEDRRPWCSAVVGDPAAPLAVLIARRPVSAAAFGRGDVRLADVLVGQAESWLSVADLSERHLAATRQAAAAGGAARALGDLGARTTPALSTLRDSANRLAGLAEGAARVDDIVGELHLVELAVASLLGAVALAAEPDLLDGPDAFPAHEAPTGDVPARHVAARAVPAGAVTAGDGSADWTTTGLLR
jgi:hypothetical protein